MTSMRQCPQCGEYHYHKSHTRNFYERARKKLLNQRIYRCHRCNYRGWENRVNVSGETITRKQLILYLVILIIASFVGLIFRSLII